MGCKTFGWLAAILAASIIAGLAVVPNASAAGPYDQPYGVQWNFVIGEAKANRPGVCRESPDGTIWITNGRGLDLAYSQISPGGLILQGNRMKVMPGMSGYNQGYNASIAFAGTDPTAYIGAKIGNAKWTDASPPDTITTNSASVSFSVSSLAGTTPVDYDGLPIPNAAGLDPTNKFTFDMVDNTYYCSGQELVMASDHSYYLSTANQGPGSLFTAGDFSGPAGTNYSPAIGHISADGLTLSGPAHQPAVDARAYLSDCDLNEAAGKVYGAGYAYGGLTYFDADGPGPSPQVNFTAGTASDGRGYAVAWDTTTWAVDKAVTWESSEGGERIYDIRATSDDGFVVCGFTYGDMDGHTNPATGTCDGYIEKYNSDGTLAWSYQAETSHYEYYASVQTDADGNIYVAGVQQLVGATDKDGILMKFNLDGTLVWTKVNDNGGTSDAPSDVGTISKDAVYLYGTTHSPTGTPWPNAISYEPSTVDDFLLQKMSPGDFDDGTGIGTPDGFVYWDDIIYVQDNMPAVGTGIDTFDFNEDGDSTSADLDYFMQNIFNDHLTLWNDSGAGNWSGDPGKWYQAGVPTSIQRALVRLNTVTVSDTQTVLSVEVRSTLDVTGSLTAGQYAAVEAGGRMNVDGSLTADTVSCSPGGTVSGGGSITAAVMKVEGTVAPGAGVGTLTVDGAVELADGAAFEAEVILATADKLVSTGTVTLGDNTWLNVIPVGGGDEFLVGSYLLISAGAVDNTFANVTPLGSYVTGDGVTYDPVGGTVTLTLEKNLNPADANLDGATDVSDRIIWNTYNFTFGTVFTTGDWNNDGATDVSDRIIWNSNNFTFASAAPAGPIAAEAAGPPSGDPKFIYDFTTGVMRVEANGNFLTEIVVQGNEGASLLSAIPFQNTRGGFIIWMAQNFNGKFQAYDAASNGDPGDFDLAEFAIGLDENDFLDGVDWGSVPEIGQPGGSGTSPVTIVPEPATLALLGLGGMVIALRRRRVRA